MQALRRNRLTMAVNFSLLLLLPGFAAAQEAATPAAPAPPSQDARSHRGHRHPHQADRDRVTSQPVAIITRAQIDASGADLDRRFLQHLTASGKSLNAKFNSSGNFGYPASGGGIGAGSAQVDLRNLGSQRVLVLVDGIRWVNESSASGVSGSADLNTIPMAIVDRIEVLEDGASAIYGSDAIAGVVNIITRKNFDGAPVHAKYGSYGHGGDDHEADLTIGGSSERVHRPVQSPAMSSRKASAPPTWDQSSFPVPGAGIGAGSSATPQGRFTFCDPRIAVGRHARLLRRRHRQRLVRHHAQRRRHHAELQRRRSGRRRRHVPQLQRRRPLQLRAVQPAADAVQAQVASSRSVDLRHQRLGLTARQGAVQQPPVDQPGRAGADLRRSVRRHRRPRRHHRRFRRNNPYNPFGIDLDPATNFGWITKRPLEVGPRIFNQDVDTWYVNLGPEGIVRRENSYDWNVDYVHSANKADQTFFNGFNIGNLRSRWATRRSARHAGLRAAGSVRRPGPSDDAGDAQLHRRAAA